MQLKHCQQSCINRPLVHSCDSRLKPNHRLKPRSIDSGDVSQRAGQPLAVLHRASVSRYSLRSTSSPHQVSQCVLDSSVALPRIGDYSHCCCSFSSGPSSLPPIVNLSFRSNTDPFHCLSGCSRPLRVLPTAVAKEPSLTNDVWFPHLHVCICHVRLHYPARVLSELPVP